MVDELYIIPARTRIGHVHLTVADLEQQLEFYQRVLGFQLHWREGRQAALGAGQEDLLRLTEDPAARRARGTTGLYHFAVLYPQRRELARSVARLFSMRYPNYPTDHLMTETTYLDDPEGNGIELYVDTPERGRWEMSEDSFGAVDTDGNPHSGREPLDVEGLLKELSPADRLEQAAPEETVIGHVHLHVADLETANRFYHGILGFEIQGISQTVGVSFLSAGGYHHHLGLNTWLGQGAPAAAEGALGLQHFQIVIPEREDLQTLAERARQAELPIQSSEAGLLLHDPSRNAVLLTQAD